MKTTDDMVSHPPHYDKGDKAYEPYRVIAAWGCNFNIGSAIKYLARYENKWNPVEDLRKAKQYIDFEIERLSGTGFELRDAIPDTAETDFPHDKRVMLLAQKESASPERDGALNPLNIE